MLLVSSGKLKDTVLLSEPPKGKRLRLDIRKSDTTELEYLDKLDRCPDLPLVVRIISYHLPRFMMAPTVPAAHYITHLDIMLNSIDNTTSMSITDAKFPNLRDLSCRVAL
jgi:hypothetical protein